MSEFIGPALPPGFAVNTGIDDCDISSSVCNTSTTSYGPSLPPQATFSQPDERIEVQTSVEDSGYGPCLPPGFLKDIVTDKEAATVHLVGPALPPGFIPDGEESGGAVKSNPSRQSDEESIIGPLPTPSRPQGDDSRVRIKEQFESRSKAMKERLTGKKSQDEKLQREDWMLVLPAEFKPSGVGPRKFRTGMTDCGDRSVWTDTPADRLRKAKEAGEKGERKEKKKVEKSARDKELEDYVNKYNKHNRPESLMSMHRKRRAEEQNVSGEGKERKPFNRETDLEIHTNLVTPAKRKALTKDSKHSLESKFTHGSKSFL